jgi:hypothetical protein
VVRKYVNLSLFCGDRVPAWLQSSIITVDKSPYFQQGGKTDPLEEWCVVSGAW